LVVRALGISDNHRDERATGRAGLGQMSTVSENLVAFSVEIEHLLTELLTRHSSVFRWHDPYNSSVAVVGMGHYRFRPLAEDGKRLQALLLERYRRFFALLNVLLREHPAAPKELRAREQQIVAGIEQSETLYHASAEAVLAELLKALHAQTELIGGMHGAEGGQIYIPDTNALLSNPNLELWRFGVEPFTLVFVTKVVSELDALRLHGSPTVKAKANSIARQFQDFRRRGRITEEAVTLVSGVSSVSALATEPKVSDSLPWLDAGCAEDRILASTIEIMRMYPRASVTIVTRDTNLHNKAEYARVPSVEPPDAPAIRASRPPRAPR
jgi:hypothetical protein